MFSTCCYILVCPTGKNNYEMLEIIFWPVKLTVRILKMMIGKLHFSLDGTFRRAVFQILGVRISTMHILNIIGISSGFAHFESHVFLVYLFSIPIRLASARDATVRRTFLRADFFVLGC